MNDEKRAIQELVSLIKGLDSNKAMNQKNKSTDHNWSEGKLDFLKKYGHIDP